MHSQHFIYIFTALSILDETTPYSFPSTCNSTRESANVYPTEDRNKITFSASDVLWNILEKRRLKLVMIRPTKKLTDQRSQGSSLHSADWFLFDPHVIPRWQLLNKWKEMCSSFQRRSWGRNAWRIPKRVCAGGYFPPAPCSAFSFLCLSSDWRLTESC